MLSINKQIHKYSWRETPQTKTNKQLDNLQNKKFELKTNSLENHIHTFYLQVDMVQFNWIKYLQKKAVQEWTELVQFTMLSMPCLLSRVQEIQILKKKETNKQHQRRMAPIAGIQGAATSSQRGAGASGRK